jgi:PAS domain S-box-containing protein
LISALRLERELSTLHAVASACLEECGEDSLLERITDIMCRTFGIHNFGVVLLDPLTGLLHDHPSARRRSESAALHLRLGEGIVGTVALSGRTMRIPDVRREPCYRMGDPETRSELTVPLQVRGQTLGVISFESRELDAFDESDERLLVILAGHLATALARLRNLRTLREQEGKYRALFENSGLPMVIIAEDSTIAICNFAFEELAGCGKARIEGRMTWMDFVAFDEDLARIAEYRNRRWTDPDEVSASYEYTFRPVAGELRHVSATIGPIQGTFKVLVILQDITVRQRMEAALVASERRYHTLFNNVPVGLYRISLDGRYLEANRAMLQMHGCHDLVFFAGRPERHHFASQAAYESRLDEIRDKGFSRREIERVRADGSTFWVDEHVRLHREAGGLAYIDGIAIDLTERKQAEAESERLRERLKNAEKVEAIGQLAGGIAHDFNNQLTIILGFADALQELTDGEVQGRYLENITRSCQRSAEITKQLLAFARKAKLLTVPLDLHDVIRETSTLLACSLDKRIVVLNRLEAERSVVIGDPNLLQNALMNMAFNVRDAMPEGGELVFSTRVCDPEAPGGGRAPSDGMPGPFLEVCIGDTGIGMDLETQGRVFEPFFTTKELGKGTGLGMASVYGTVKQHNGTIRIESGLGEGCRIFVGLPLVDPAPAPPPTPSAGAPLAGKHHVLIVDDDELMLDMFRGIFASMGCQATTFDHPIEAVAFFREACEAIDLVLVDLVMPGMGGEDLFLALRVIRPEVRIVLMSGLAGEGEAQRLVEAGARGYLQKPFRKADLLQELRRVLQA